MRTESVTTDSTRHVALQRVAVQAEDGASTGGPALTRQATGAGGVHAGPLSRAGKPAGPR